MRLVGDSITYSVGPALMVLRSTLVCVPRISVACNAKQPPSLDPRQATLDRPRQPSERTQTRTPEHAPQRRPKPAPPRFSSSQATQSRSAGMRRDTAEIRVYRRQSRRRGGRSVYVCKKYVSPQNARRRREGGNVSGQRLWKHGSDSAGLTQEHAKSQPTSFRFTRQGRRREVSSHHETFSGGQLD